MKLIFNIKKTLNNTKTSFKRFSLGMTASFLSALFFILGVYSESMNGYNGNYTKNGFLFLLATFCFVFIDLFLEGLKGIVKNEEDLQKYKLIKIVLTILSILIIYGIKENMLGVEEALFSYDNKYKYFGLLLFFIISSFYIAKLFYHKDYIAYVIKIIEAGFISFLYSGVVYLGLSAIFSAFNHLIGLKISLNIYIYTAICVFIPFNIGIFLSNFPKGETSLINYEVSKAIRVLLNYILMPIFTIYIIILYIYFAKILFIGELPKNILIHLILWFSLFSVIYLFVLDIIKDSKSVRDFKRIFPILMIPVILVMFYSILLRIGDYGITENRYLVIAGGILALASMVYYVFYRSNSNVAIPILLSVVILISTIGPVSAYDTSANSQNSRLKKVLIKNNMLNGNKIVPKTDISDKDKARMSQIVRYMCNSHRSYELNYVPSDFNCSDEMMKEVFGFDHVDPYEGYNDMYYNFDAKVSIDIEGYAKLLLIDSYPDVNKSQIVGNYKIRRKSNLIEIYFNDNDKEIATINMNDIRNKLKTLKKTKETIDPDDLSIKGKSENMEYKIVFTSLNFYEGEVDSEGYSCSFYFLTNTKN